MFHQISKLPEYRQRYSAACCIFNSLLCVWKSDETPSLVFDILQKYISSLRLFFFLNIVMQLSPLWKREVTVRAAIVIIIIDTAKRNFKLSSLYTIGSNLVVFSTFFPDSITLGPRQTSNYSCVELHLREARRLS